MPQPSLPREERSRRKGLVESLLKQGYAPLRVLGGLGSATEKACEIDQKVSGVYARWIRSEESHRDAGREHFVPDWSLYAVPGPGTEDEPQVSPREHAQVRASNLATEITTLVMASKYPLINPEAIVVDSHMERKYDRHLQDYVDKEGTPRTWLTETLRVAPIEDPRSRRFLFTSAQNDAPIHELFWENLQAYAAEIDAEIVVGPFTYETQWWSENNPAARAYDPALTEHLCFGQLAIGDQFIFAGEMNTLPTASAPISDLVTYSRGRWAVFPHAKRQLKSVPVTDPNMQAHQVMTTGSVTMPKIIPRKAGIKSLFHHVIGATLVEFDHEGDLFCRQISAGKDGSFYDLDRFVKDGVVTRGHPVEALVCGDIHLRKIDRANALATFGFDPKSDHRYASSIIDALAPQNILLHDIFDNETRNHHHQNDNAYSYEMAIRGRDSVFDEVKDVAVFLGRLRNPKRKTIVVDSNHDLGLERWVREGRYRNDGANIRYGLQLEDSYLDYVERRSFALDNNLPIPRFSILEHAVRTILRDEKEVTETFARMAGSIGLDLPEEAGWENLQWAHDGYSFVINGVECGHHGFRGANGAKGTIAGYARVGRKISIGDKHSPEIMEGVYCAGVMQLRQGYNKGPSGWAVSHIVQYPDGHRTIITLQKGKWRAEKPRITVPAKRQELEAA